MPVVPITKASSRGRGFSPKLTPNQEPFALMAAAQMHAEGRLVEPTADSELGRALGTRDLDKDLR